MSELLVGSYVVLIPCLTRPGITRRISFVECANAGGVGATLRFKQEKRQTSLAASSALDGYSLSLPKRAINRSASNLDRIKNQAIAKQSGCVHTTCANVRTPSQFIYCVGCDRLQIAKFLKI
ncbi:hypothetical protein O3645_03135 [Pauljensenia sp. 27098_8_107]